jgi:hypothetical protein
MGSPADTRQGQAMGRLFGLLCRLMFAQAHARPAAILVDELDAGCHYGAPDR